MKPIKVEKKLQDDLYKATENEVKRKIEEKEKRNV